MFASSVVLFLTVRKAALAGYPSQNNNLAMFGVPMVIYLVGSSVHLHEFTLLTPRLWILLIATSIFLAYTSNAASLRSIELAPNPGYSLIISKSSVVLTVFLAVPLLGSKLALHAVLAVALIVAFSFPILIDPHKAHHAKSESWLPLAFVAFVGWALLSLSTKYLFIHGVTTLIFLAVLFAVVTACIAREIRHKHISLNSIRQHRWLFLQIGIGSAVWNFFLFYAIKIAPNPGYMNATNAEPQSQP